MRLAPRQVIPLIVFAGVIVCVWATRALIVNLRETPPELTACTDDLGTLHTAADRDQVSYGKCLRARAQVFMTADYAEMKDLAKSFLTLLIAVLVASITFSEKVVDFSKAGTWSRLLMITSWVLLLIAIVTLGAGLAFMTIGAGSATYQPNLDYQIFEAKAIPLYVIAGVAFGSGLAAMLLSGVAAIMHRSADVKAQRILSYEEPGMNPS